MRTLSLRRLTGMLLVLVPLAFVICFMLLQTQFEYPNLAPDASEAQRAAALLVFEGFHRYAGTAVGEHLGYLSTSLWTFLIAILMLRSPLFGRWLGWSGMVLAIGVATGLLEPAGWELAGTINALSYLAWALWLIVVGLVLLIRRIGVRPLAVVPSPAAGD